MLRAEQLVCDPFKESQKKGNPALKIKLFILQKLYCFLYTCLMGS
jgi:hypothetical protein